MNRQVYEERFLSKVQIVNACWIWTGATGGGRYGYGQAQWQGYRTGAHRVSWLLWRGELEEGQEVDHTCGNRLCVNPDHLQLVTHAQNKQLEADRNLTCRRGHQWTEENTYLTPRGDRQCRACIRHRIKGYRYPQKQILDHPKGSTESSR